MLSKAEGEGGRQSAPNDDSSNTSGSLREDGVGDDGDANEHVAIARNDGVLRDLSSVGAAKSNADARYVADSVLRDGSL
jgi:hypothetical protein